MRTFNKIAKQDGKGDKVNDAQDNRGDHCCVRDQSSDIAIERLDGIPGYPSKRNVFNRRS